MCPNFDKANRKCGLIPESGWKAVLTLANGDWDIINNYSYGCETSSKWKTCAIAENIREQNENN